MGKQRNAEGSWALAAARWFSRVRHSRISIQAPEESANPAEPLVLPARMEQSPQFWRIWRNLTLALLRISRPTRAEIAADEYDGSVPISEWLARRAPEGDVITSRCQAPAGEREQRSS